MYWSSLARCILGFVGFLLFLLKQFETNFPAVKNWNSCMWAEMIRSFRHDEVQEAELWWSGLDDTSSCELSVNTVSVTVEKSQWAFLWLIWNEQQVMWLLLLCQCSHCPLQLVSSIHASSHTQVYVSISAATDSLHTVRCLIIIWTCVCPRARSCNEICSSLQMFG